MAWIRIYPVMLCLAVSSCKTTAKSQVKIIGGTSEALSLHYPVQLILINFAGGFIQCSGFFVSDRILVTSAHCLDNKEVGHRVTGVTLVQTDHSRTEAESYKAFEAYASRTVSPHEDLWFQQNASTDVATVLFPLGTAAPDQIVTIADVPPVGGERVALKGSGATTEAGAVDGATSVNRLGYNTIMGVEAGTEAVWVFRELNKDDPLTDNAAAWAGDSGSPLFDRDSGRALAICSAADMYDDAHPNDSSVQMPAGTKKVIKNFFVSLFNPAIRGFLTSQGVQLPPIKHGGPEAGSMRDSRDVGVDHATEQPSDDPAPRERGRR